MDSNEVVAIVSEAISPEYRNRLIAKGQARSMILRDGTLPDGAPNFPQYLQYDLKSYAYSLLDLALRLRASNPDDALARTAFEQAASALAAAITNADSSELDRGFHRLLAASSYHLGRFSARAYSLLRESLDRSNLSPIEHALALLILRSFANLEGLIAQWCLPPHSSDAALETLIERQSQDPDPHALDAQLVDIVDLSITANFMRGVGMFILALETGEGSLVVAARAVLTRGFEASAALDLVPQWWCHRVAIDLMNDLWSTSFHEVLPDDPPDGLQPTWRDLRNRFIMLLASRGKAEVDLWPSQIDAAIRAVDIRDNLVVCLPTSSGKTRVAELCILRTLAEGKRVVFVTPLRALSAQTEVTLRTTFGPLGMTISTLYGSIGTTNFDEDLLRDRNIVVATPEKLDFALRNDPTLIDDVGLVVLDEGHMIGLGEREVRYEVQVQRLLKRSDAENRRVVCLSAVLPEGDQFDDFLYWLRMDKPGTALRSEWRPTRLLYGEVIWRRDRARLQLRVGEETSFVPAYFSSVIPPPGRRRKSFPSDQRELVLATAWRLVADGHSVLIYCPERRSVEPYARAIVKLESYGLLTSVLNREPNALNQALAIGEEWLGSGHAILKCLTLGVAIHHGALPTAFRQEMERLLAAGVLRITVSSPTLAQGLNLTATALLFHGLIRNKKAIPASEFRNVVGRAGRAFVDVEGITLYPMFSYRVSKQRQWESLLTDVGRTSMESGLFLVVRSLLLRLHRSLGHPSLEELLDYVINNATAWDFPEVGDEADGPRNRALRDWQHHLSILDTAILSLCGDTESTAAEIAKGLDEILSSSLWERHLSRKPAQVRNLLDGALRDRAQVMWSMTTAAQRKGYFLAGIGLASGIALDAISEESNRLLINANSAIVDQREQDAVDAVVSLAEMLFRIPPFTPNPLPDEWRVVIEMWLSGASISKGTSEEYRNDVLRFVEDGLTYRLPWGMEAVRLRALANSDKVNGIDFGGFELGLAVPAVETGTLNRSAAILIQAGGLQEIGWIGGSAVDTGGVEIKTAEVKVDGVAEALAVTKAAR